MASAAISSQGTIIKLGGATISEITGWSGFGTSADTMEVTNIDSPDDYDEHVKVILRGGEGTLDMNYTAASYATIQALVESFSKTTFSLQTRSPDNKIYSQACDVTSNAITGSAADKISASVGIKFSGGITITDAP